MFYLNRAWIVRTAGLGIVAAFLAVGAIGTSVAADDDIPLGFAFNRTGYQAVLDIPSYKGALLALSEINAAGGIGGRRLSAVAIDGNSVPASLERQVTAAVQTTPAIAAFLGLSDSDMVLAAAGAAARQHRLFLTSGATSPELPMRVPEYLFLACFGDNVQAAAAAEWAFERMDARTAAVLFDPDNIYTRLLSRYFTKHFKILGGVITENMEIDPGAPDAKLSIAAEPDIVFLSVETAEEAVPLITRLRANGYDKPIIGGDGYDADAVWSQYPQIADVYFTTHVYLGADSPNPKVNAFTTQYKKANDGEEPNAFAALGYDAVGLIAMAISNGGSSDPAAVLKGMSMVQAYHGVTGRISFPSGHRIPQKSVTLLRVQDGREVLVDEFTPKTVPKP